MAAILMRDNPSLASAVACDRSSRSGSDPWGLPKLRGDGAAFHLRPYTIPEDDPLISGRSFAFAARYLEAR